MFAGLNRRVLI